MDYKTTSTSDNTPFAVRMDYEKYKTATFPDVCDKCSNNLKNGGSGICFCTIGTLIIK